MVNMPLSLLWMLKYGFLFNLNRNKIIIFPYKIEFIVIDLPWSCPTLAANNIEQSSTIGSDKVDQCSCELTTTYLLIVGSSSL